MNIQQVREAIDRMRRHRSGECVYENLGPNPYVPYRCPLQSADEELLFQIADALTEPTPLTVERLVERGYVHDAIRWPGRPDVPCLRRGKLYVYSTDRADPRNWSWEIDDDGPSIWPVPRTVGELAMIEHLMEGR